VKFPLTDASHPEADREQQENVENSPNSPSTTAEFLGKKPLAAPYAPPSPRYLISERYRLMN